MVVNQLGRAACDFRLGIDCTERGLSPQGPKTGQSAGSTHLLNGLRHYRFQDRFLGITP